MRAVARSIALAVGVALALTLPAAAQGAANPKFYGVFYGFQNGMNDTDLNRMDTGGVGSTRWNMFWQQAQPVEGGGFNWAVADEVIGELASREIQVMPTLYGTPDYMANNSAKPPVHTDEAREGWKNFVQRAVLRYGPNGIYWTHPLLYQNDHPGSPPMPIEDWQVWNEPNLKRFFHPRPSARKYVKLLRITAKTIRSVDPAANVIMAGMPPGPDPSSSEFLDRVYDLGGKPHFDAAALHPYARNVGNQKEAFQRMRKVMRRHHDGGSDLWSTEMGWGSGSPRTSPVNRGPQGQKRMLKKSFGLMLRNRQEWNLRRVFWFEFRDPPDGGLSDCGFCGHSGLFKKNFDPKPSWRAFKQLTPP